jgi:MFS family permease
VVRPVLFVQTLGWADTDYAQLLAVSGLLTAVSAVMVGSALVDRFGPLRTLVIAIALEAVVNTVMGFTSSFWSLRVLLISIVMMGAVIEGVTMVARTTVFMALCWQQAAATQFALYTALAGNLGLTAGGGITGPLNRLLDYSQIFLTIAVAQIGICLLLRFVNLTSHRTDMDALDTVQQPLRVAIR